MIPEFQNPPSVGPEVKAFTAETVATQSDSLRKKFFIHAR